MDFHAKKLFAMTLLIATSTITLTSMLDLALSPMFFPVLESSEGEHKMGFVEEGFPYESVVMS